MRTLLFVDDHPIYREGLRRTLLATVEDLAVDAVAGETTALARLHADPDVDLVLADHRLADGDGLELIRRIKGLWPLMAVGVLCAEPTAPVARRAREIGAVACLSKDRDAEALAGALETLFNGGLVFDDAAYRNDDEAAFTLRRREILQLAADGLLDKQIGDKLGISESTVRNHWQHLFLRLKVANRTEAVSKAIRRGMI